MKKNFIYLTIISASLMFILNSCTKEQMLLNMLYGTWVLDSATDCDGDVPDPNPNITSETLVTFYRCNDKEEEYCNGTSKTTTTFTSGNTTTTTYSGDEFEYVVYGKDQLVMGGTYYEIQDVSKKELVLNAVSCPKQTITYSKQ